jgi:hypothetical protein
VIGTTMSFSFPLLSLVLERRGVAPDLIGLNAAAHGFAVFTVAPWLPRIVNRLGAAWTMALGRALCIVRLLLFRCPLTSSAFDRAGHPGHVVLDEEGVHDRHRHRTQQRPAISEPQKNTSPLMSSLVTPTGMVLFSGE